MIDHDPNRDLEVYKPLELSGPHERECGTVVCLFSSKEDTALIPG